MTGTFSAMLFGPLRQTVFVPDVIANFSGYIRENQGQLFSEIDSDFVQRIPTPTVPEKASKLLRFISKEHPYAGQQFSIPWIATAGQLAAIEAHGQREFEDDPAMSEECEALLPYVAASWSRNAGEFLFLLNSHLTNTNHFLEEGDNSRFLRITPQGWNYLQSIETNTQESTKAFVAMWFNSETEALWKDGIRTGVYAAGYEPIRVDAVEHTNKIDDEIIAQIRASKFVIADFTGQRGGVYFEAGFALGLEKRVIWCVEEAELQNIHFDNRQYNFLRWKKNELPVFKEALSNRIEALFGKGPVTL